MQLSSNDTDRTCYKGHIHNIDRLFAPNIHQFIGVKYYMINVKIK